MPRHMPRPKTSPSKPIAKTIAKPKSKPKVKKPKAKSPATEALKALLQQRGLPEETIAHRVAALMTGTHAATRDTHLAVSAHTRTHYAFQASRAPTPST